MTEVNIPLLRKEVEWVEEQDQLPLIDRRWDQRTYFTSAFNHAHRLMVELINGKSMGSNTDFARLVENVSGHCGTAYCLAGHVAIMHEPDNHDESEAAIARRLLGLDFVQAEQLFSGGNTAKEIRFLAEYFAGQKL